LERPPEFVARTIAVHPVDGPQEARDYLTQHRLAVEAWSIAGARDDVVDAAVASGAVRIAAFGSLQDPPLASPHGGRSRIVDFVRWIGDEAGA
jgi:hypothetical protein